MNDPRTFCKNYKCIKWTDELLRYELEEANEVCHGNWIGQALGSGTRKVR